MRHPARWRLRLRWWDEWRLGRQGSVSALHGRSLSGSDLGRHRPPNASSPSDGAEAARPAVGLRADGVSWPFYAFLKNLLIGQRAGATGRAPDARSSRLCLAAWRVPSHPSTCPAWSELGDSP